MPAQTVIKLRRDTAADWTTVDPILAEGELGVELDTNRVKIGDGATEWSGLDYFGVLNSIDDVSGVVITSATSGEVLQFDGTNWINAQITISQSQVTNLSSDLDSKLNLAGGTMTGKLTLDGDPTQSLHASTKGYVDNVASGIIAKPQVLGATSTNIDATYDNGTNGVGATLTHNTDGEFPSGATGVTGWQVGTGILLRSQTNKAENGRYVIEDMGSSTTPYVLRRCSLCDEADEIPGAYVFVQSGNFEGSAWVQVVDDPANFVVGTDDINLVQFSGPGAIVGGTNISVTGNQISTVTNPSFTSATIGSVSNTEIQYLDGVTSSVQSQLDGKVNLLNSIFNVSGNSYIFVSGSYNENVSEVLFDIESTVELNDSLSFGYPYAGAAKTSQTDEALGNYFLVEDQGSGQTYLNYRNPDVPLVQKAEFNQFDKCDVSVYRNFFLPDLKSKYAVACGLSLSSDSISWRLFENGLQTMSGFYYGGIDPINITSHVRVIYASIDPGPVLLVLLDQKLYRVSDFDSQGNSTWAELLTTGLSSQIDIAAVDNSDFNFDATQLLLTSNNGHETYDLFGVLFEYDMYLTSSGTNRYIKTENYSLQAGVGEPLGLLDSNNKLSILPAIGLPASSVKDSSTFADITGPIDFIYWGPGSGSSSFRYLYLIQYDENTGSSKLFKATDFDIFDIHYGNFGSPIYVELVKTFTAKRFIGSADFFAEFSIGDLI